MPEPEGSANFGQRELKKRLNCQATGLSKETESYASRHIIDRCVGKPVQIIELTQEYDTFEGFPPIG